MPDSHRAADGRAQPPSDSHRDRDDEEENSFRMHAAFEMGELDTDIEAPDHDFQIGPGSQFGSAAELGVDRDFSNDIDTFVENEDQDDEDHPWSERFVNDRGDPIHDAATPRFQRLRLLDRGGLGEVYEAWDLELGRIVVVKRIKPQFQGDPTFERRFLREARITALLQHPGVVPVHGLCRGNDGQVFYAMRKVDGTRFDHAIVEFHRTRSESTNPRLEYAELLRRFRDICRIVEYAHSENVIHCDIKPSNVMLRPYGETLLLDWGLARQIGVDDEADAELDEAWMSAAGTSMIYSSPVQPVGGRQGTLEYMSPEQLTNPSMVGKRSDVFNLGATLFQVLTGEPPTKAVSGTEGLLLLAGGGQGLPSTLNPSVPKGLEAICLKAMRFLPQDRYDGPAAIVGEIDRWLADERVEAFDEPPADLIERWLRKHRTVVAGTAAAFVTAIFLTSYVAVGSHRDKERAIADKQVSDENFSRANRLNQDLGNAVVAALDATKALKDDAKAHQSGRSSGYENHKKAAETTAVLLERLKVIRPDDIELKCRIAENDSDIAILHQIAGNLEAAEAAFQKAQNIYQEIRPYSSKAGPAILSIRIRIGQLKWMAGRPQDAIVIHEEVVETIAQGIDSWHKGELLKKYVGPTALNALANDYMIVGRGPESLKTFERATQLWRAILDNPNSPPSTDEQLVAVGCFVDQAAALLALGKSEEAQALMETTLQAARTVGNDSPDRTEQLEVLINALLLQSRVWIEANRKLEEARTSLDEAIALVIRLINENRSLENHQEQLAKALRLRSRIKLANDQAETALSDAESGLTILKTLAEAAPALIAVQDQYADALGQVAALRARHGETELAASLYQKGIAIETKILELNRDHPFVKTRLQRHRLELQTLRDTRKP